MKLPERMFENAKQLTTTYSHANQILHSAMRDAMPWAMPLATQGVVPSIDKIERLATQLVAILMATYPDDFQKPIKGFTLPEQTDD